MLELGALARNTRIRIQSRPFYNVYIDAQNMAQIMDHMVYATPLISGTMSRCMQTDFYCQKLHDAPEQLLMAQVSGAM